MTYADRPALRAMAAAAAALAAAAGLVSGLERGNTVRLITELAIGQLFLILAVAAVAALVAHVKEQFGADWRAGLVPGFVAPHLAVGAFVYVALAAAVAAVVWMLYPSSKYSEPSYWGWLAVVGAVMAAVAWASLMRPAWASLLLVPVLVLALQDRDIQRAVTELTRHYLSQPAYYQSHGVLVRTG